MGHTLFHICREHKWVSEKSRCPLCKMEQDKDLIKTTIIDDIKRNGPIRQAIINSMGR